MILFCNDYHKGKQADSIRAIPQDCVKQVIYTDSTIKIYYFDGDYDCFAFKEFNGISSYPQIKVLTIHYESNESALNKMREFYTACKNNDGAYFF